MEELSLEKKEKDSLNEVHEETEVIELISGSVTIETEVRGESWDLF